MPEWTFRAAVLKSPPEALSSHEKIVLLVLASHVNDLGSPAWPSFNTIAEMASISRSSAIRAVKSVTVKGWIAVTRRRKANGVNKSNVYRLKTPDNSFISEPAVDPVDFDDGSSDDCIDPVEKGSVSLTPSAPSGVTPELPWCHGDTTVVSHGHPNKPNEVPNELNQNPGTGRVAGATPAGDGKKKSAQAKEVAPSTAAWDAFSAAYTKRYGVEPLRNAKVNAALKKVVESVGADKAPLLAAHYLTMGGFYVQCQHDVTILVRDIQIVWNNMHKASAAGAQRKPATMADYDAIDYSKGVKADGSF
ncbi:helix-turn-helix domain-containing protein [Burkholderia sp. Ac-20349]|uniref:helix-turn-helix domain-containing protein n=1 Tax=Burkholderia sp. Ac-20349 TaxID=2703893 RepID=UPI00197C6CC7|nr:helix-turn-helix domain-containing protein [Burkholderia sp. Ac-20349]MBN3839239.1 helix-turn-helix domain-containing protein [Burkholderia sp. Ac-20349]